MEKQKYIVVSFSGGKDSTAMLLRMIELGEPIDEVIWCDTYKEFPAMYRHVQQVRDYAESMGIKFTELKSPITFDEYMFTYEPKRKNEEKFREKYGDAKGNSWPTFHTRWCTGKLKIQVIERYIRELKKQYQLIQCVGLAADEEERLERENNKETSHRHPLVEWGWTEKDCLEYCYSLGYDWEGLYNHFSRVSCWCCPLQPLEELRKLRKHYPELWKELIDMDKRTWLTFKTDYTVEELDKRFAFEEERLADGKSIRNREFFTELKARLGKS